MKGFKVTLSRSKYDDRYRLQNDLFLLINNMHQLKDAIIASFTRQRIWNANY